MSLPNVVFLDAETLDLESLDTQRLSEVDACLTLHQNTLPNDVVTRIESATAVLVNKVVLSAEALRQAPKLKYIGVTATGMNNVDLAYCKTNDIKVQNVQAYGTSSVAQHTLTLLLNLATQFVHYQHDVNAGAWSESSHFCLLSHPVVELEGMHAVIVGHGELGKRVEDLFKAMGMQVTIAGRPGRADDPRPSLSSLLPSADVVSLHCPLTQETDRVINAETLSLMKPNCFLINTARGGLVDEPALFSALKNKQIGGAGLDVLSVEPPPSSHILMQANLPNLLITPHNAWVGKRARQTLLDSVVNHLTQFLAQL